MHIPLHVSNRILHPPRTPLSATRTPHFEARLATSTGSTDCASNCFFPSALNCIQIQPDSFPLESCASDLLIATSNRLRSTIMAAPQAPQQKLPTGLAGVLNRPEEHRDSAYYSVGSKREHSLFLQICNPICTDWASSQTTRRNRNAASHQSIPSSIAPTPRLSRTIPPRRSLLGI